MAGAVDQLDSGVQRGVAVDLAPVLVRQIPMRAHPLVAQRTGAARLGEVTALDDELGIGELLVTATVVGIEMSADNLIDVRWLEIDRRESGDDVLFVGDVERRVVVADYSAGASGVDQHVGTVVEPDQVSLGSVDLYLLFLFEVMAASSSIVTPNARRWTRPPGCGRALILEAERQGREAAHDVIQG